MLTGRDQVTGETVLLDRAWIVHRIPHQGSMCLLDAVLDWNAGHIRCRSRAHRSPQNPLRARGRLGAVCGIEFAAQAMAVHGALAGQETATVRPGYLVSARGVNLLAARLDDIEEDLIVSAARLGGDAAGVLYEFSLTAGSAADARILVSGRAAILVAPRGDAPRGDPSRGGTSRRDAP